MPPRDSPDQGRPRGGRPPRRGHRGGATHGSQSGSPSSTNAGDNPNATPQTSESTPASQANSPSAFRRPSDNRGRVHHSRGRRATPGSPLNTPTTPPAFATTITETGNNTIQIPSQSVPQANSPSAFRQPSENRGRGRRGRGATPASTTTIPQSINPSDNPSPTSSQIPVNTTQVDFPSAFRQTSGTRGRTRGHGASPGDALGSPLSAGTPPTPAAITAETASSPPSAFRGQPSGHRGSVRGNFHGPASGHPGRFRGGRPSRGHGGGGGSAAITDFTSIPGKSNYSTKIARSSSIPIQTSQII